MAVDSVIIPVHCVPEISVVRAVVTELSWSWSNNSWILCINYFDDLLVLVAVSFFIPERREVCCWSTWSQRTYSWFPTWNRSTRSRNCYTQTVLSVVRDCVRLWIWNSNASCIAVVLAPVQHSPSTLDLEASIRNYSVNFINIRYCHQFAVLSTEELRSAIVSSSVASRYQTVIWELHVVVLVVCNHNTL